MNTDSRIPEPTINLVEAFKSSGRERVIKGKMPAKGYVRIGRAYVIQHSALPINRESISPEQIQDNLDNLQRAIEAAKSELKEVKEKLKDQPIEVALQLEGMLDFHEMNLDSFGKKIADKIKESLMNGPDAAMAVIEEYSNKLKITSNAHVIDDYRSLGDRIIRNILAEEGIETPHPSLENAPQDCFVIADKLSPSDCIYLVSQNIRGLIIQHGAASGHVAVIAKELGIPAIFTESDIKFPMHDDMPVIIDGQNGRAYLNPSEKTIQSFEADIRTEERKRELRVNYKDKAITSKDNVACRVYCNVNLTTSVHRGKINMADGVGLYRTEWLFTSASSEPSIEQQIQAYDYVIKAVDGHSTTFRLLDTEGDKNEQNWIQKADRWQLMRNQVRAMMIAASQNNVSARILLPVVRSTDELATIREYIEEAKSELEEKGIPVPDTKLGMMVEIVTSAMEIEDFVNHADFFSIGSNDLIAWTCGQIRNSEAHAAYEDPTNRSVLNILEKVIQAASDADKTISLCGRIASNPKYISLLMGLGLRKFSTGVENVLEIKEQVEKISVREATILVNNLRKQPDRKARESMLAAFNQKLDEPTHRHDQTASPE